MIENRVLVMEQWANWEEDVLWLDDVDAPEDINGFTAKMDIRRRTSDSSPLISLTDSNGRLVLGGVEGTIRMKLNATETGLLPTNDFDSPFVFDLILTDTGGLKTKILKGKVVNRASATAP